MTTNLLTLTIAFAMNAAHDARQAVYGAYALPVWHADRAAAHEKMRAAETDLLTALASAEVINDQGVWVETDTRAASF